MSRIVVDPVTRIEGHLRIEAEVEGGIVKDAWSSGTMFRGLEQVVQGRDPREAWFWLQRVCSVCTVVHALASVRAVEDALEIEVPDNARLVRNLVAGVQLVHDHVVHFYHLHALDWVDVANALRADPARTAQLASSLSDWPKAGTRHFRSVQEKVRGLIDSGQLSLFASGYWGHPAYALPPETNLLAVSHYLDALEFQREFIRAHAVLGAKNPHPQTFLVGGMSTAMDPASAGAPLNPERLAFVAEHIQRALEFVAQVYLPDVLAIAGAYGDWFERGEGIGTFLSYGGYPERSIRDPSTYLFAPGFVHRRDLSRVEPFSPEKVTEDVTRAWYHQNAPPAARHPFEQDSRPDYTGPEPPFENLDVERSYSWIKAPRYDGQVAETGPLARVVLARAAGNERVRKAVDDALARLKRPPEALFSTLGRVLARALETELVAAELERWISELEANMRRGELRMHEGARWDPATWPRSARGFGRHEAPRGALGHWIEIEDRVVRRYQIISPTTWNGSPRDEAGRPSAYEAALVGHPVADPERPLELLRTIHSFDPCLACAVQVIDVRGRGLGRAFSVAE